MAEIITMPKLGFDMAEGTLIRWVKAEGEAVEKGELLAEIETDKATVEVESMYSGTVRKHLVGEGAIVPVNDPIAVVGAADEEIDFDALAGPAAAEEVPAPAQEKAEVAASSVEAATSSVEAATSSVEAATTSAAPPVSKPPASQVDGNLPDGVRASPLARNMAAEKKIDLSRIAGTGPGGRIVKKDIEAALASPAGAAGSAPAAVSALPGLTPLGSAEIGPAPADTRVPLSRLRQAIGRRMVQSKQEFPSFYVTHEYDIGPVMSVRKQANKMLAGTGEKLSVNDFVVKAAALTLRQFPNLNAKLDGDAVLQYGRVSVGVAVAVENGLLTVVCQDTDRKGIRQVSQEIKEKAGRARSGKIRPDDVDGSTFSISNLGMFDVETFVAIINPPEAAILAVGSALQVPVVEHGAVVPGWRMKATISVDHRVSDGAEAARFMQTLGEYLENPAGLLL